MINEISASYHCAGHNIAVAGEVLGGRMYDQIDTCSQGVERSARGQLLSTRLITGVCASCAMSADPVPETAMTWVIRDTAGERRQGICDCGGVGAVHKVGGHAEAGTYQSQEPVGIRIAMIDANDTVTCPDQPEYGIADCGDAAGEGQRLVTAFEKAKLLQQSRDRRIVNTGVSARSL